MSWADEQQGAALGDLVVVAKADGIYDTQGRKLGDELDTVVTEVERRFGVRPVVWKDRPPLRCRMDAATAAILEARRQG